MSIRQSLTLGPVTKFHAVNRLPFAKLAWTISVIIAVEILGSSRGVSAQTVRVQPDGFSVRGRAHVESLATQAQAAIERVTPVAPTVEAPGLPRPTGRTLSFAEERAVEVLERSSIREIEICKGGFAIDLEWQALRVLVNRDDAAALLLRVIRNSRTSPTGRSFALTGLRCVAPDTFRRELAKIRTQRFVAGIFDGTKSRALATLFPVDKETPDRANYLLRPDLPDPSELYSHDLETALDAVWSVDARSLERAPDLLELARNGRERRLRSIAAQRFVELAPFVESGWHDAYALLDDPSRSLEEIYQRLVHFPTSVLRLSILPDESLPSFVIREVPPDSPFTDEGPREAWREWSMSLSPRIEDGDVHLRELPPGLWHRILPIYRSIEPDAELSRKQTLAKEMIRWFAGEPGIAEQVRLLELHRDFDALDGLIYVACGRSTTWPSIIPVARRYAVNADPEFAKQARRFLDWVRLGKPAY